MRKTIRTQDNVIIREEQTMKKLFDKSELIFAIALIVVYVVGSSLVQRISAAIGMRFVAELAFDLLLSVVIIVFVKKNGLMKHIGLCKSSVSFGKMLFYVPLVLIACTQMFFGAGTEFSVMELVFRTLMMFCVGFLEEIIFRGFLFRGIAKDNVKEAIIISSVTFGIGHIVNLFNGYDILKNVIQIVFAVAVGFMLVFIVVRTGSLIACIVFHALVNSLSAVSDSHFLVEAVGSAETASIITAAIGVAIAIAYTIYVVKALPKRELAD